MTLKEAVKDIVSLGLGVEFWAVRGDDDPEPTAQMLEEIRRICEAVPFVSMHTRRELWEWNPEGLRREISFCSAIGARTLVVHPGTFGLDNPSSQPDSSAIRQLAQSAGENGVTLALENVRDSRWALDWALKEIGDDPTRTHLGVCIDVGHAHLSHDAGCQPVFTYLEHYKKQLVHLHLHDNLKDTDDHRLPGKGSIAWVQLLGMLDAIGYGGPAVLELHAEGDPLPALKEARAFLDCLL